MKRHLQRFGATVFVLLPLFILVQTVNRIVPEPRLRGVTEDVPRPVFSLAAWFAGDFQDAFTKWFNRNLGLRAVWIRTDNQINFSIFREISSSTGTKIILGKDNWLYEREYVEAYAQPGKASEAEIEKVVSDLRLLQDELDRRNIPLLVVISPSKAEIYPEAIPPRYLPASGHRQGLSNYERTVAAFERHGIRVLDGHKRFLELKDTADYALFPKGGIHWNYYGAYQVVEELVDTLNPLMRRPMPVPSCRAVVLRKPRGNDTDLGELINIWTRAATAVPTPYLDVAVPDTRRGDRPAILIVGDSFSHQLVAILTRNHISGRTSLLYYYRRLVIVPGGRGREVDRLTEDPETFLDGQEALILEINERMLPHVGFGFVSDLVAAMGLTADGPSEPPSSSCIEELPQ